MYTYWSEADDATLVRMYPIYGAQATAAELGRSLAAVYSRVKRHGLAAPQRKYPPVVYAKLAEVVQDECSSAYWLGLTPSDIFSPHQHKAIVWIRARVFRRMVNMGHSRNAIAHAFGMQHGTVNRSLNLAIDARPPPKRGTFDHRYRREYLVQRASHNTQVPA